MYFRTSNKPSSKPTTSTAPARPILNAAQRAREGSSVGAFTVTAKPGFNIEGRHKFQLIRRGDRIKVEYCKICNQARSLLRIGGADIDYVQDTFRHFDEGWPLDTFDQKLTESQVTSWLINHYNQLFK